MKRALSLLLIALGTLAILFVAVAMGTTAGWARGGYKPWPANLGRLQDFPSHFPRREPSADALRLAELARSVSIDFMMKPRQEHPMHGAIAAFVHVEQRRDVVAIGEPPARITEFIATHAAPIDALRDHVVRSREIAWTIDLDEKFKAPLPNLRAHLQVARLFVARALIRARDGDTGAWEDLRAAFVLDSSIHQRPELISQLIALSIARMINAAAWKMPLPTPAWLADFHAIDHCRLMLRGLQHDTWLTWRHLPQEPTAPFGPVSRPYLRASMGNMAVHQRATAIELVNVTTCAFDGKKDFERRLNALPRWNIPGRIAIPDFGDTWSRAMRSEAEREATANALRARAGVPVSAESRCSDGTWRYEAGRLSFTREIPPVGKHEMPLALSLR